MCGSVGACVCVSVCVLHECLYVCLCVCVCVSVYVPHECLYVCVCEVHEYLYVSVREEAHGRPVRYVYGCGYVWVIVGMRVWVCG